MKDITGKRFGRLVAIEPTKKRLARSVVWKCRCDCGKTAYVAQMNLQSGHTKSCGCFRREISMKDIAGKRFGRLIAIEPTQKRSGGSVVWKCRCDCGQTAYVSQARLQIGKTKSCGCFNREKSRKDIAGKRFGRLVAIEPTQKRLGCNVVWKCRCDCGQTTHVAQGDLQSGDTKSCGCFNISRALIQKYPWLTPDDVPYAAARFHMKVNELGRLIKQKAKAI